MFKYNAPHEEHSREEWVAEEKRRLEGSLLERKRRALADFRADETAEWSDIDTGFASQYARSSSEESAIVQYIKRFY